MLGADPTLEPDEHAAYLNGLRRERIVGIGLKQCKSSGERQVALALRRRRNGDSEKPREFRPRARARTLGNVGRNRTNGVPKLASQTHTRPPRRSIGNAVNIDGQRLGTLPDDQLREIVKIASAHGLTVLSMLTNRVTAVLQPTTFQRTPLS